MVSHKSTFSSGVAQPPPPRTPIIEQLAAELLKTDGSISRQPHGVVYRIASSADNGMNLSRPWDMAQEWKGAELTNWEMRSSTWSKTLIVRFFVEPVGGAGRLPAFTLHLQPPLTDEEVKQLAEVYMQVLNLRRV